MYISNLLQKNESISQKIGLNSEFRTIDTE